MSTSVSVSVPSRSSVPGVVGDATGLDTERSRAGTHGRVVGVFTLLVIVKV